MYGTTGSSIQGRMKCSHPQGIVFVNFKQVNIFQAHRSPSIHVSAWYSGPQVQCSINVQASWTQYSIDCKMFRPTGPIVFSLSMRYETPRSQKICIQVFVNMYAYATIKSRYKNVSSARLKISLVSLPGNSPP
jgi:hypothetical protein